ncbi:hypothetical protein [Raoultella ornithinolytica]|uniref:hypothetical protein n=1 Tax=Raoultella ornithinolytica TaxID=54291 RepID=UPI00186B4F3C|nr:hypothetical protein [Raoultella ornithinolytica]
MVIKTFVTVPPRGGDGVVLPWGQRSTLYWLHAANNSRGNSVSVSGDRQAFITPSRSLF